MDCEEKDIFEIVGETGAAMVEFALVVFGIIAGTLMSVDVSLAVSQYMLLSQASYEGLRLGATLPELGASPAGGYTNLIATPEQEDSCVNRTPTTFPCQHYLIHERIRRALSDIDAFDSVGLFGPEPGITTEYVPSTAGTGVEDDTIIVRLNGQYSGFFLPNIPLSIDHQAAYLYQDI